MISHGRPLKKMQFFTNPNTDSCFFLQRLVGTIKSPPKNDITQKIKQNQYFYYL